MWTPSAAFLVTFLALCNGASARDPSKKCDGKYKLALNFINETRTRTSDTFINRNFQNSTCADGSKVGYYFDQPPLKKRVDLGEVDYDTIIWFGEGPICSGSSCDELCSGASKSQTSGGTICDGLDGNNFLGEITGVEDIDEAKGRCLASRAVCTSSWWSEFDAVTPQTVLCHEDDYFKSFKRIYVPSCTLDWWLGKGDSKGTDRFKGYYMAREVLIDMAYKFNITYSNKIVIGGTLGSTQAVTQLIEELPDLMLELREEIEQAFEPEQRSSNTNAPVVVGILDSPWAINTESFSPKKDADIKDIFVVDSMLKSESLDWIQNAALNKNCTASWSNDPKNLYKCLYTKEVLPFLSKAKLLIFQSLYDLVQLYFLETLDSGKTDLYPDDVAYATGAISYIESYGQAMRSDMEDAAAVNGDSDNHYFFVTPCGQPGYIVATSVYNLAPQVQSVGSLGSVQVQRDYSVWATVKINGLTVRDAIVAFVSTNGTGDNVVSLPGDISKVRNNLRADTCSTFLCNENCATKIIPFEVQDKWTTCYNTVVVAYGIAVLIAWYIAFFLAVIQVFKFDRFVRGYWQRIKSIDTFTGTEEVQQQLLNEATSTESYRRIHIMVENMSYSAPPRSRGGHPYKILHDVSLAFAPGKVHALMGPSGSGKSTLLDLLALTRENGSMLGHHYINGVDSQHANAAFLAEWLKHNSSYVRQTDVLFPRLTVREHLTHAAWLMLPQYMKAEAKLRRVWQVIRLLELDSCADTKCGDGGVTVEGGISGGQRRRVSVATQLLKLPAVLLLDEPTSGLDSTNALLLVRCLHTLAHQAGVNVLMTIHQPRKEIFSFFDSLSFLVAGRVVFSGNPEDSKDHFGLPATTTNIANDILDLLQSCPPHEVDNYEKKFAAGPLGRRIQDEMESEVTNVTDDLAAQLKEVLIENSLAEGRWSWSMPSSDAALSWVLLSRTFKRGGFDLHVTFMLSLVGGVVVGLVFRGIDTYQSKTALAYLAVATMTFLQGTFVGDRYLGEKAMFDHESDAGTFRAWIAFMMSQFMRDAVTSSVEGLAFAVPVYWLGGLNPDIERFLMYMLIMTLTSYVCICQNVLIEVDRDDLRTAALVQIALLCAGALFNGFIVQVDDLPVYMSWVPYVMLSYWSFVGTLINDFSGYIMCNPTDYSVLECAIRTGDNFIRLYSYENRDVYICLMVLVLMSVVFRISAIVDFFLRYVVNRGQGQGLKRLAGATSVLQTNALSPTMNSPTGSKSAMSSLLQSQTPSMRQLDTKGAPSSPQVSQFELQKQPSLTTSFYEQEEDEELSFVQSSAVLFLCDRNVLLAWFLIDFFSTSYICAFQVTGEETTSSAGLLAIGSVILTVYMFLFFYQMIFLIPTTLNGKLDCTWAGWYDAAAFMTLVVDAALTFQNTSGNVDAFQITIILTSVIKVLRLLRIYLFWNKVDHYHRVRANSFLEVREEIIANAAAQNTNNNPDPKFISPNSVPALPPSRIKQMSTSSLKRISLNMRSAAPALPMSRGPNNATVAVSNPSFNGARQVPPSRPQRPQRPAMMSMRFNKQAGQIVDPGPLWKDVGGGYYYNPHTGQTISAAKLQQRPPPLPPSRR